MSARISQRGYVAAAVQWLQLHDGRTTFTTGDVYNVYRFLIPAYYRLDVKGVAAILRASTSAFGITKDHRESKRDGFGRIGTPVVVWKFRDTLKGECVESTACDA